MFPRVLPALSLLLLGACAAASPSGIEGYLDTQRAAADQVCRCASSLDMSVNACLRRFDVATFDEASENALDELNCLFDGLDADPESEAVYDCYAEAAAELEHCANNAGCGDGMQRCVDRNELALARCPSVSMAYNAEVDACRERNEIRRDPLGPLVHALETFLGEEKDLSIDERYELFQCIRPVLEGREELYADHAACAVPMYRQLTECMRNEVEECPIVRDAIGHCPPMDPIIEADLLPCWP